MPDATRVFHPDRWGLILAGGEGRRLRPLTRILSGAGVPKQFCAVLGRETLLERTRRRAAHAIAPARTLVALTRAHEPFYRTFVAGMPEHCAVVQPEDRGTATAILYGLLRIAAVAPAAAVAILPSDHYVSDDGVFMGHVSAAFATVSARPELIALLGIAAGNAEVDYGWIEPAEPIAGTPLRRVARFWEKPAPAVAEALFAAGALWNSLVVVARVAALLGLIRRATPDLYAAGAAIGATLGTLGESVAVRAMYRDVLPTGFSERVLAPEARQLVVLPVRGVQWSDWGTPERVAATLATLGMKPAWAGRLAGERA
jgi:mannose-1-phosphate guanylyltransferase